MSYYPSLQAAREAKKELARTIRTLARRREDTEYDLAESESLMEFTELEVLKMMRSEDFESERDTRDYLFANAKQDVELHAILRKWIENYDDHITLSKISSIVVQGGDVEYFAELLLHLDKNETSLRTISNALDKMSLLFAGNRELKVYLDTDDNYVLMVKNGVADLYRDESVRKELFSNLRTLEALSYIVGNIL
ncbi:MAG: hypothetical protein H9W81_04380 [Enterococcus sp.]|nr:hypothetical protein [Enterococcus sp.]